MNHPAPNLDISPEEAKELIDAIHQFRDQARLNKNPPIIKSNDQRVQFGAVQPPNSGFVVGAPNVLSNPRSILGGSSNQEKFMTRTELMKNPQNSQKFEELPEDFEDDESYDSDYEPGNEKKYDAE